MPTAAENDATIVRFYEAFDRHDGEAMAAAYAPHASFSDPVFPDLQGEEPGGMWRMLTAQATELKIELLEHGADETTGHARWRATYLFSQTGRNVVNDVRATFRFDGEGLIVEHRDDFSFYRWARQALGPPGLLLGWSPIVKGSVRSRARGSLNTFMDSATR